MASKEWIAATCVAVLCCGCGESNPKRPPDVATPTPEGTGEIRFRRVARDDQEMTAAMEKARSTVSTFIAALRSPAPKQTDFAIKAPFAFARTGSREGGQGHLWLVQVEYDGTQFHGMVGNTPVEATGVEFGQLVSVDPAKISDWMYVEDGKLVGGETIRAMVQRMSPEEKQRFEANAFYVIE